MAPGTVEISIPNTNTSSTAKPYTLYNISLRLPLRSFILAKRYSDFTTLHSTLTTQAGGVPPPAPLPSKSWFTRTTSSPELTEERRKGLETYLKAINEDGDARWRGTSAWRAFLNLPSGTSGQGAGARLQDRLTSPGSGGAPITDPAIWLDCHRDVKTQLHDARLHLQRRDQADTLQGQHESSAAAKRCLVKAGGTIAALDQGLRLLGSNAPGGKGHKEGGESAWESSSSEKLGEGELRRRRDLVSTARKEKEGLETLAHSLASKMGPGGISSGGGVSNAAASEQDKAALFGGANGSQQSLDVKAGGSGSRGGRVLGAPLPETERTRELDNNGVLQLQKQLMEDQDLSVEQLTKGVRRLRELGVAINEELLVQSDLLKLADEDSERLGSKINVAKKRVGKIS
ncbi:MAG: emp24p/erv25p- protein [Chaenotheca gracillima]|nr:MAG: emp24p/erv25p- protein [Chaenotheca gracillima]